MERISDVLQRMHSSSINLEVYLGTVYHWLRMYRSGEVSWEEAKGEIEKARAGLSED